MKKMVVIGLIAFIFILVIFYFIFKSNKECVPFTGGSFSIIFNTNGGDEISSMSVCIACSPDSYLDLPVPVRDGYVFDGWYYDNGLGIKILKFMQNGSRSNLINIFLTSKASNNVLVFLLLNCK